MLAQLCALSRITQEAARANTMPLRVSDATDRYLMKYTLTDSEEAPPTETCPCRESGRSAAGEGWGQFCSPVANCTKSARSSQDTVRRLRGRPG